MSFVWQSAPSVYARVGYPTPFHCFVRWLVLPSLARRMSERAWRGPTWRKSTFPPFRQRAAVTPSMTENPGGEQRSERPRCWADGGGHGIFSPIAGGKLVEERKYGIHRDRHARRPSSLAMTPRFRSEEESRFPSGSSKIPAPESLRGRLPSGRRHGEAFESRSSASGDDRIWLTSASPEPLSGAQER